MASVTERLLTESPLYAGPSGNALQLLKPREHAVIVLLATGLTPKAAADVLRISRETLYQDRRRAWETLRPVVPASVVRYYDAICRPGVGGGAVGDEEDGVDR